MTDPETMDMERLRLRVAELEEQVTRQGNRNKGAKINQSMAHCRAAVVQVAYAMNLDAGMSKYDARNATIDLLVDQLGMKTIDGVFHRYLRTEVPEVWMERVRWLLDPTSDAVETLTASLHASSPPLEDEK